MDTRRHQTCVPTMNEYALHQGGADEIDPLTQEGGKSPSSSQRNRELEYQGVRHIPRRRHYAATSH